MKTKAFVRDHIVAKAGGVLEKVDGTHHVFRFPNGMRMIVPMGGRAHTEAKPYLFTRLEKLLRGERDRSNH